MGRRCLLDATTAHLRSWGEPTTVGHHRRRLLARAAGRVLDLSPSWRDNLRLLDAAEVTSIAVLSSVDSGRPATSAIPLGVLSTRPEDVVAEDGAFDTVIATSLLCTVADPERLLAGVARWVAPGGQLLVLQHVLGTGMTGVVQRLASPAERLLGSGCRLDLDLQAVLRRAGLDLVDCARFDAPLAGGLPVPFVAGVARPRHDLLAAVIRPAAGAGRAAHGVRGDGVSRGRRP